MIRIRYRDLSPGLHGKAEHCGRGVTIYLLPGLTGGQRKAALRRLRQEASRGCGPALPVPQLAVALVWDRVRVAFRNAAAIVRLHPAATLLHAAAASALMTVFVLASVSVPIDQVPLPAAASGDTAGSGSAAVPAAFSPSVRGGVPSSAPVAAALWSLTAPARTWADGEGLGSRAHPGSGSGDRPGFGSGIGVPAEVSIGAQRSP
jgi:hypothetical protein